MAHDSLIKHQWVIALHNVFLVSDSSTKMADTGDGDQRISSEIDGTYSKFSMNCDSAETRVTFYLNETS